VGSQDEALWHVADTTVVSTSSSASDRRLRKTCPGVDPGIRVSCSTSPSKAFATAARISGSVQAYDWTWNR
jgi:hypothetical protein